MAAPKGNNYAAKDKEWRAALKRALSRSSNLNAAAGLDKLADKVVREALDGCQWAVQEIGNRIDGKPHQSVELSGTLNHNHASELSDDALAHIATGGSLGAADAESGETEPAPVH